MNTDTPRTDAIYAKHCANEPSHAESRDWHDLARTLEREVAAQAAEIARLREALNELDANCENRQGEPFIAYVRKTARAALVQS